MKEVLSVYRTIEADIAVRLREFEAVWRRGDDRRLWREMCFCMCTPQTSAHKSWEAVCALDESGLLVKGSAARIGAVLRAHGVRFHNHKSEYIEQNRKMFYPDTKKRLGVILESPEPHTLLCRQVRGWGMKEAAHFLRNIGFGHISSILDRHILRRLLRYGVIDRISASLTPAAYRAIDEKMKGFAEKCGIPLAALDLVFWHEETGEIFK
jgi:N-glycosylase/DNA lyase